MNESIFSVKVLVGVSLSNLQKFKKKQCESFDDKISCLFCFALMFYSDDRLSLTEFSLICRALFRNDKGQIYAVAPERLEQMFAVFDKNEDGYIDRDEFQFCWNNWIKTVNLTLKYLCE